MLEDIVGVHAAKPKVWRMKQEDKQILAKKRKKKKKGKKE